MNLDDLWIGDVLRIKSTGTIGIFSGQTSSGLAIIKTDSGFENQVLAADLEIYTEPEKPLVLTFEDDQKTYSPAKQDLDIADFIDLHYDQLTQYYLHERGHILEFQLEKCEEFILKSIANKAAYVRIIHGKGEGVLKKAVDALLKKYSSAVSLSSAHFDGASIDVWFR